MSNLSHKSAKPSHYDKDAKFYDAINEEGRKETNRFIETALKKYKVKTVLDLTCGTGSQVFWLNKKGFEVVGSDFSVNMLKVARAKAKKMGKKIKFLNGDMRTIKVGKFDAVISIFNAVGHLTKSDFEKAMRNVSRNLNDGGIYIFDIFNLNYALNGDNITKFTIDIPETVGKTKIRKVQFSTIDKTGNLASYTSTIEQRNLGKPKIVRSAQTLQVYSAKQLKEMLARNSFKVLKQCSFDGSRLYDKKTENIVTIAKKV